MTRGRSIASNGYMLIRVGKEHPLADVRGYAYEHRVVASQALGRVLKAGEVVHHVDGNKLNNIPSNLEVLSRHEHLVEHRKNDVGLRMPGEPNTKIACACGCGSTFMRYDSAGRPRAFISGHNVKRDEKGQWCAR